MLLNQDDNVREGVSGDGGAPVTPHTPRVNEIGHFNSLPNLRQFFLSQNIAIFCSCIIKVKVIKVNSFTAYPVVLVITTGQSQSD